MNSITQDIKFRLSILHFAEKYGVSKAAIRYRTNRQFIYRLIWRYDSTAQSLAPKSRRPHHHPNEHSVQEVRLISNMRRRNPNDGLVVFWVKLRLRGYRRSISGLYRFLRRNRMAPVKLQNPKYVPKPYAKALFPGEKVQVDVKHVPSACIVGDAKGKKFYQYTAIDECTRFRYIAAYGEASTYSSTDFLERLVKRFRFPIKCIQTDNGFEFTNRFGRSEKPKQTLFEKKLELLGIVHKKIRPFTPRHNGKVERSHRKDNEYFYASHCFFSFVDFKLQLAKRNREYNSFPMRPLDWRSPIDFLRSCLPSL